MQRRRTGQFGLLKPAPAQRGVKRGQQAAQAAPAAATERDSPGRTTRRSAQPAAEATSSGSARLPARAGSRRLTAASTAPAPAPTSSAEELGAAPAAARGLRKRPEPEPELVEPVDEAALGAALEPVLQSVAKPAAKPAAAAALVVHHHRGRSDEGVLKTFDGDDITDATDHSLQSLKLVAVKNSDRPKPQRGACGIFWCRAGGATWGCATCAVRICSFECWQHHTKAMAPLYHHNSIKPEFEPLNI